MENTSYISLSRQMAVERQMESVANNLANVNTTSYKTDRTIFSEFLTTPPNPEEATSFVHDLRVYRVPEQGAIRQTGEMTDFSLNGDGYFIVETPDKRERYYTRDGMLRLDNERYLSTQDGLRLVSVDENEQESFIEVPESVTDMTVARDGSVLDQDGRRLGRIKLAGFEDEQELKKIGENRYSGDKKLERDRPDTEVVQYTLESSNVNSITEITNMMELLRHYEAVQKMVENDHDRQTKVIQALSSAPN